MARQRDPLPAATRDPAQYLPDLPDLPATVHPVLRSATVAAVSAVHRARREAGRAALIETVGDGADGTPTSRLDRLAEDAILEAVQPLGVNVLSEECGFVDHGSALTLVIDPVDGTGNAAAGLPLAAFTGALSLDGVLTEALTYWLDGGSWWHARRGGPAAMRTTGRRTLDGALVSMIRPKADSRGFLAVAARADRTRVLGSSALEAAWVAAGVLDASLDAGSDTHRYVDVAAAVVLVEAAGGVVVDLHGRSLEFTTEITRRWSAVVAASAPLAEDVVRTVLEAQR